MFSSFYGQAKPEPEDLSKLAELLDVPHEGLVDAMGPNFWAHRGLGSMPPKGEEAVPIPVLLHCISLTYLTPIWLMSGRSRVFPQTL